MFTAFPSLENRTLSRNSRFPHLTHQHRSPLSLAASSSSVFSTAKGQVNSASFSLGRLPTATEKQRPRTTPPVQNEVGVKPPILHTSGLSAACVESVLLSPTTTKCPQICPPSGSPLIRRRLPIRRHFPQKTTTGREGKGEEAGSHLKQRRLGKKKKRTDMPKRRKGETDPKTRKKKLKPTALCVFSPFAGDSDSHCR
uniref:Uncharacterized protein n=1 Tax=Populus trichocarpa TaxID=3694 RepID=A0A3N7H6B4_POPTR